MEKEKFFNQVAQELLERLEKPIYGVGVSRGFIEFTVRLPSTKRTAITFYLFHTSLDFFFYINPTWSNEFIKLNKKDYPELFAKMQELYPTLKAQAENWESQRKADYWRSNNSLWHRLKYFYWDLRNHYRG